MGAKLWARSGFCVQWCEASFAAVFFSCRISSRTDLLYGDARTVRREDCVSTVLGSVTIWHVVYLYIF